MQSLIKDNENKEEASSTKIIEKEIGYGGTTQSLLCENIDIIICYIMTFLTCMGQISDLLISPRCRIFDQLDEAQNQSLNLKLPP